MSSSKFNLVSIELFDNKKRFGNLDPEYNNNNVRLYGQFIVINTFYGSRNFPLADALFSEIYEWIAMDKYFTTEFYRLGNITWSPLCFTLQIAKKIILPTGGETICILKTFWIKIIQRKWKKIYKQRKQLFQNIYLRQVKGKLTFKNVSLPSLRGMLSDLV
jgi:hypothetical protein